MKEFDVAIVGGGMVGASLALALAAAGKQILVIEGVAPDSQSQPSFDDRTTALGNASQRVLAGLGVWEAVAPVSGVIRAVHVSDAGRCGFARLQAGEHGIPAFGYVVANRALGAALWQRIGATPGISVRVPASATAVRPGAQWAEIEMGRAAAGSTGAAADVADVASDDAQAVAAAGAGAAVRARLVVAADGVHSAVRRDAGIGASEADYGQVAIVANVAADVPHDGTAYERFTDSGPLALVPLHDGSYTVVWARRAADAPGTLGLGAPQFLQELQRHFGWRAGRFVRAGRRASYPLKLTRARQIVGERTVLIGNAAQSLHPVAGQGFNLALRDVAALAELIAQAGGDAGAPALLQSFAAWRAADRRGVVAFTDGLIRLFGDARPPVRALRDAGLLLFDLLPPAKNALAKVSLGFGGRTPRLARGLRLT